MNLYHKFTVAKKCFMMLRKLFFYAGMNKYFVNTRLSEFWMDYSYLEGSCLSDVVLSLVF